MNAWTLIRQSLASIWQNGFRSILTILGVVIGIAAVISLMALGKGLQEQVTGSLGDLGSTSVTVSAADPERQTAERGRPGGGGSGGPAGFSFGQSDPTITTADYEQVLATPNVVEASLVGEKQLDVTLTRNADTVTAYSVLGVDSSYQSIEGLTVAQESFLSQGQVDDGAKVVVLGAEAAQELFPTKDPIGKNVFIGDTKFQVTGVLAPAASDDPRGGVDGKIITGYEAWLALTGAAAFTTLTLDVADEESVESVVAEIETNLTSAHEIAEGANPDFSVRSAASLLETRSSIVSGFTSTLTGIAAISLLVGGIGIMNIMLVTVTERTREIGLRRAVGAKARHILAQFLTEAVVLTTIGGVVGLALGYLFSSQIGSFVSIGPRRFGEATAVIDPQIAIIAVAISVMVGIIFGMFPAIRAARLDPAEALRYE